MAHECEDMLEELKGPAKIRRTDTLNGLKKHFANMADGLNEVRKTVRKLASGYEESMLRIPFVKAERLNHLAVDLKVQIEEAKEKELIETCYRIHYKPLRYLASKYSELVRRVGQRISKKVNFIAYSEIGDVHPESLSRIDEALIHIVRNAVDHGIENDYERELAGKGIGEVKLTLQEDDRYQHIIVSDNGRGINLSKLVNKAIDMGYTTTEKAAEMTDNEKMMLIFAQGLSTSDDITDVSGTGSGNGRG